jgi:hypothetical protein
MDDSQSTQEMVSQLCDLPTEAIAAALDVADADAAWAYQPHAALLAARNPVLLSRFRRECRPSFLCLPAVIP